MPLIPTAAAVLDEHLATAKPKTFIFEKLTGQADDSRPPRGLVIRPTLAAAELPWYGLHAFRRGLATNLHELGVADIVIQAILRHSNVSVTRAGVHQERRVVDPQSLAAMDALESAACNQHATETTEADDTKTR